MDVVPPNAPIHPLERALYFDTRTFLHGLLVIEDKLSMAHGSRQEYRFSTFQTKHFIVESKVLHPLISLGIRGRR